jgi:hypothetical protein
MGYASRRNQIITAAGSFSNHTRQQSQRVILSGSLNRNQLRRPSLRSFGGQISSPKFEKMLYNSASSVKRLQMPRKKSFLQMEKMTELTKFNRQFINFI